jgi:hypothetical protein
MGGAGTGGDGPGSWRRDSPPRLPPVRLAPREELAGAARVVPLLRAARDIARWARRSAIGAAGGALELEAAATAAADLELAPTEVDAAWRVAVATRMLDADQDPGGQPTDDVLASGSAEQVLAVWAAALEAVLAAEDLDGLATALYTVGGPVRMEGLFDAYAAAAGTRRSTPGSAQADQAAALSAVLETLADLGVVELGTEECTAGSAPRAGMFPCSAARAAPGRRACWSRWPAATLRTARRRSAPGSRPGPRTRPPPS